MSRLICPSIYFVLGEMCSAQDGGVEEDGSNPKISLS